MNKARNLLVLASAVVVGGGALLASPPASAAPASPCTASIVDTFAAPSPAEQVVITITVTWSHCAEGSRIRVATQLYSNLGTAMFPQYGGVLRHAFRMSAPSGTATKAYRVYVQTKGEIDRGLTVDRNAQGVVGPFINCTVPPQPWDEPGAREEYSVASRYSIHSEDSSTLARGRSGTAFCVPLTTG